MIPNLERLLNLGVDHRTSAAEIRWVRTISVVALTSLFFNLLFTGFYTVLDFGSLWPVILTNGLWSCGYVIVIWMNGRRLPRRAAWLLLGIGLANTLIPAAVLGIRAGVYLFIILVPMLGVLISDPEDDLMRAIVISVGAVAFVTMPMLFTESLPIIRNGVVERWLFGLSAAGVVVFGSLFALYYRHLVARAEAALEEANNRSEKLLLNILPASIAERLKVEESPIADRVEHVTVLFADLVDSTPMAERLSPDTLVGLLNRVFSKFDDIVDDLGLEKIATIGDCYMAVAGLIIPRPDHASAAAAMALRMREAVMDCRLPGCEPLEIRIGMSSGPVVAGVIGKRKFRYDLWGDTVNTASRMESHGRPGMIHVTRDIQEALHESYVFEPRGTIPIKGKGDMQTYFLIGSRAVDREPEGPIRPAAA